MRGKSSELGTCVPDLVLGLRKFPELMLLKENLGEWIEATLHETSYYLWPTMNLPGPLLQTFPTLLYIW